MIPVIEVHVERLVIELLFLIADQLADVLGAGLNDAVGVHLQQDPADAADVVLECLKVRRYLWHLAQEQRRFRVGGSVEETSPCCTGWIEQLSVAQRLQRVEVACGLLVLLLLLFVLLLLVVVVELLFVDVEDISRFWPLSQISRYWMGEKINKYLNKIVLSYIVGTKVGIDEVNKDEPGPVRF